MDFFKLDKIDKIFICITFIVVTLFCVLETFCFATDIPPEYNQISPNLLVNGYKFNGTDISVEAEANIYYIDLSKLNGVIIINSLFYTYGFTNSLDGINTVIENSNSVFTEQTTVIDLSQNTYNYLLISKFNDNNISVYVSSDVSMNNVIDTLVSEVGISNIWDIFSTSIPYISVVVLASFGFYLIFHNIKELSKGREKIN